MIRRKSGLILTIGAGLLLLAAIVCAKAIVPLNLPDKTEEHIPFDVVGWNAPMTDSAGYFTGTRLKMVDDLLKRYDFHDWSNQDVQELLGEPFRQRVEEQWHIDEYDLRKGLNLLIFEFDDQDKVVDYCVRIDD